MMTRIFFSFGILIALLGCSGTGPGEYDSFAQCLAEKGAKMYGTDWCSHCKVQKKAFGSSFQYIDYIDCDKNRQQCAVPGISIYPTWIIDGDKFPGEQPLYKLASLSKCKMGEYLSASTSLFCPLTKVFVVKKT